MSRATMTTRTKNTDGSQHTFELSGGRLCLDFANTVDWRLVEHRKDFLVHYSDLVSWSRQTALLQASKAKKLLRAAARRPRDARAVLKRAKSLRELIYEIFSAAAARRKPTADGLAALNQALAGILAGSRIVQAGGRFEWAYGGRADALAQMLWPVAQSAADLLTAPECARVRECAQEKCGWLFLDTSRNHSRRWCDMKTCGNRNKARRFYERKKADSNRAARRATGTRK